MSIPYPERIRLAHLPTPVQKMENLSRELGAEIYIKRDDLTGVELSGNKVRKLEFLLADAMNRGADTIITTGGIQSNHCRATAAACARIGLLCHLILRTEPPKPPYDGNLLLDYLFGAEITYVPQPEFKKSEKTEFREIQDRIRAGGRKTYYFPVGGSIPMGAWGYTLAFEELAGQLEGMGIEKAQLILAVGSGGTQTGLHLGRDFLGKSDFRITGFNVCDSPEYFRKYNADLYNETVKRFNLSLENAGQDDFHLIGDYMGPGYAIPYPESMETIRQVAEKEGIILDPAYTGKAFHGLLEELKKGSVSKDLPIVFIHTGGIYGIFPQKDLFNL